MDFNREMAVHFGPIAKDYDAIREDCPGQLYDDMVTFSGLNSSGRVLEVGCGTGISTVNLAKRGLNILAVDMGEELVEVAKRKTARYPMVSYLVGKFEDLNFLSGSFDLVAAIRSWHWIDPAVSYKKAHDLLRRDGTLAASWIFMERRCPLVQRTMDLFSEHCSGFPNDFDSTTRTEERFLQGGYFHHFVKGEYFDERHLTKQEYTRLISTYSWVINSPDQNRKRFFAELSLALSEEKEPITIPYRYVQLMAKRKELMKG